MTDWLRLIGRSESSLLDLVEVDAACSAGLPGIPWLDTVSDKRRVDEMASSCARFIERVMPQFRGKDCDYPASESQFRIQAMITHLQRDLGVRHNPHCRADNVVLQPADSFLHGILHGKGGTCGSLPILYAAVGRRLRYPITLVTARSHLFCRWRSETEQFNIEASGDGVSFFPDEHYRSERFAVPLLTVLTCGYLKDLSPTEEVAELLAQRGECWMKEREFKEATTSFAWANEADPGRGQHMYRTGQAMSKWDGALRNRVPPGFPKLTITSTDRQFTRMPENAERAYIRLQVSQELLNNPDYVRRWWDPLRGAKRPPDLPQTLSIVFNWDRPIRVVT